MVGKKQGFTFENFWEELEKDYKEMIKPNILIAGKTGVGKSTLINAIFRENLVETGVGKPVTKHLRKVSKESVPVNLFDTKGLELEELARKEVKAELLNEIAKRQRSQDISEHIHIMWYCVSYDSGRIEDAEIEWIKEFSDKVPVILVLTKCIPDEDDLFSKEIENLNLPVKNIVKVLAKPKKLMGALTVPAYGLKTLVGVTFQVLPEVVRKAFINAQRVDIALKVENAKRWSLSFVAGAFGVGFTPIPFSDAVALSGIQLTMIAKITNIFGFPFSQSLMQTVISAIAGTSTATFIGRALVGNILKFIPFAGTVAGGLINGSVASALTTSVAFAYIKVCEKLSEIENIEEMSAEEISQMVKKQFEEELKKDHEKRQR